VGLVAGVKNVIISDNYPTFGKQMPSIHAEHHAMIKFFRMNRYKDLINLKKCEPVDFLVIRLNSLGNLGSSRPCKDCLIRLNRSGLNIRYVYYSDNNGSIIKERFADMFDSPSTYISSGNKQRKKGNGQVICSDH